MPPGNKPENELKSSIEVQLSLMKSGDIDSLKKIFSQFSSDVKALQMMGSVADRQGAMADMGATGSDDRNAHQSQPHSKAQQPTSAEDQVRQADATRSKLQGIQDRILTSHVHQQMYKDMYGGNSHALSNLLARGELKNWRPRDLMGVGAYMLGKSYYGSDYPTTDKGVPTDPTNVGRPGLGPLFAATALAGSGVLGFDTLDKVAGALRFQNQTAFGSNVGLSQNGIMGTRFLSPAFLDYYRSQLGAFQQSWGGLNPAYSWSQGQEAQGLINQLGYSGNNRDQLANAFTTITGNIPALPQDNTGQMLDYGFRYGAASIQEMTTMISQIPEAAQAAQMSIQSFSSQLISTSRSIAQQQGVPESAVQAQLTSLSQGTGLAPALAAGVINDQFLTNVTAAEHGGNFYQAEYGPMRGANQLAVAQQMVMQIAGVTSWQQLQHLQKQGGPAWSGPNGVMNKLTILYNSPGGKQMLGNLSPVLWNSMIGRGILNPARMTRSVALLNQAINSHATVGRGQYSLDRIMNTMGMTHAGQQQFLSHEGDNTYQQKLSDLQHILNQQTNKATENMHRRQVQVALTPEARRLLVLIPNDDPSSRNTQSVSQYPSASLPLAPH